MWLAIIIFAVIWIGFLAWITIEYKRRRKESNKKKTRPPFRTEEDLDEYAKPMKDEHQSGIDFDDAD